MSLQRENSFRWDVLDSRLSSSSDVRVTKSGFIPQIVVWRFLQRCCILFDVVHACQSYSWFFLTFISKYCYCLWWGLQNLSTLGQGLQTSTYPGEVIFSIALAIAGLILFALLIGNMQTYLQSLTLRLEEMRVKRRDSEQWMHHRLLPKELRERVRREKGSTI
ncbi:hypothetical protein P8452_73061 [Trifolium repens]|nr:hypothetical protein P8452_73061 [Trifolium repens]